MDDTRLIELAGLAAGEVYSADANPLIRDDLALRLAVKLGFINPGQWPCAGYSEADIMLRETGSVDWYAATRRAIVRAAAAMAKEPPA